MVAFAVLQSYRFLSHHQYNSLLTYFRCRFLDYAVTKADFLFLYWFFSLRSGFFTFYTLPTFLTFLTCSTACPGGVKTKPDSTVHLSRTQCAFSPDSLVPQVNYLAPSSSPLASGRANLTDDGVASLAVLLRELPTGLPAWGCFILFHRRKLLLEPADKSRIIISLYQNVPTARVIVVL